ncbi:MAG: HEPN domain-containing protein [Chloroflexi bacterium]|nr:HEPN domain-containing protein [Chloroflexota bacterium]
MDAKLSLVRKWIMKARRDLLSAKKLARGKDPYLDTAIYHCQQLAEKVIKGWLVYHDISFEKTHDLRLLMILASEAEPKFKPWVDIVVQISPYATAYRYPGEVLEPTEKEFLQAFKNASTLYEFVCSLLPTVVSAP